jgi:hypothetical protein
MKDNYIKIIIALLTLVGGTLLGAWVKTFQDRQANQMRYLDFKYQIYNNIIGRPNGLNKQLEVFLDGQKIDNLTQVDIWIYNFTDRDHKDVPLIIEINSTEGDSLQLLNATVAGQEGLPDFIEPLSKLAQTKTKGAVKVGYRLNTINRIGDNPVFTASYLIIGNADRFQINTLQPNLDLTDYNYEHFKKPKLWENEYVLLTIFIIIYVGILFWVIRNSAKKQASNNINFGEFLKKNFQLKTQDDATPTEESISQQVIKLKNIFDWQNTKKWMRFIEGRKKPEK